MRHLGMIAAIFAISATADLAMAGKKPYGMAGCGLGSIVIDPSGSQISASSTNGTFGSQLFGITSGTSNCLPADQWAKLQEQENFIVANFATLSKEIAQGNGETLQAYSQTLGCQAAVFPEFAAQVQSHHQQIFMAPGALAALGVTKDVLKQNARLHSACNGLFTEGEV